MASVTFSVGMSVRVPIVYFCITLFSQCGGTLMSRDKIFMSPSSVQKERMHPDDIYIMDAEVCSCTQSVSQCHSQ